MAAVLVVEDNADLCEMYEQILAMRAHAVRTCGTAAEALAILSSEPIDVVLLDLHIVGGAEGLAEAVRKGSKARLVLASGARDLSERATAMGAADFLVKPFLPEQLLKTLDKVLG